MKVVKPSLVSFNFRTVQIAGRLDLAVTSLIAFKLGDGVRHLVADIALWPAIGEVLGDSAIDEALPKPCGEVFVHGSCHASGGKAVPTLEVRLALGPRIPPSGNQRATLDKRLAVFGDRYWIDRGRGSGAAVTQPAPFTEMPIGWERAFGGEPYAKNPRGRGITAILAPDGKNRVPLPNVEAPGELVRSPDQRPEPASLGPIDVSWPQRRAKAGTYDVAWLEDGFPGYAKDTDPTFFCAAPPDQRLPGYFAGDEEYLLEHLHPEQPILRGKLPGLAARTLIRRKGRLDAEEVRCRLDTVVFLPGKGLGVLVYRGTTPVVEDDAADVEFALAACEEATLPRPFDHYARALARRLDKRQSAVLAIREDDLVPVFARRMGIAEDIKLELSPRDEALRKRMLEQHKKTLIEAGLDPAEAEAAVAKASAKTSPPVLLPDLGDPESMDAYERREEEAAAAAAKEIEELTSAGPTIPIDPATKDAIAAMPGAASAMKGLDAAPPAPKGKGGPPPPEAPKTIAAMRAEGIELDAKHVADLEQFDAMALESYRETAQTRPPADALDDDARRVLRERVVTLRREGASFTGRDLTCGDLSGLDLEGARFHQALLEGADFTGTRAKGADFSGSVLVRTVLRNAVFDEASLQGANLGASTMEGASFVGADLERATLARAKLRSVSFARAKLARVDWDDAELGAVSFEGAQLPGLSFMRPIDLSGCRFPGAQLQKGNFIETKIQGVDFSGANLELVTFMTVDARGACFRGASLRKLHAVEATNFEGASFEGADLSGAFLRGSNLRGANFHGARLLGADLSECDLTSATLTRAQAKDVLLVRADLTRAKLRGANLMDAMMQKARLHGADLSATNLFAANLGLVRGDTATKFTDANLKRTLQVPRAKKKQTEG